MMRSMKTDTLKKYFGKIEIAADCLGITRQGIYWWKGEVPELWQIKAHVVSGGQIKLPPETAKNLADLRARTKAARKALTGGGR